MSYNVEPLKENNLDSKVGLAKAIEALRSELTQVMKLAPEEGVQFEVGPVNLTVEVAVTNSGEGSGGIKWWLIEAGAKASRESMRTQTMHLTLNPVWVTKNDDGKVAKIDMRVSDTDDQSLASGPSDSQEVEREQA